MTKKKKGGRPRTRTGPEFQLGVSFQQAEYAQVLGYIDYLKEKARREGEPLSKCSKKAVFLKFWREWWESLQYDTQRVIEFSEPYKKAIVREE